MAWVWLLWLLSQTWITIHIWTPKAERLASTEKLFVIPMYNGLLIDQSMALNRKRDDQKDVKTEVRTVANIMLLQTPYLSLTQIFPHVTILKVESLRIPYLQHK